MARFASIKDWMYTGIKGWTLADAIDDNQCNLLLAEAERTLTEFVSEGGAVAFNAPAHSIIVATKS